VNNYSIMKNILNVSIFFGVLSSTHVVMAQRSIPTDVLPFSGSITIKYKPTFKSQCSVKVTEKKKENLFGTSRRYNTTTEVYRTPEGRIKIASNLSGAAMEGMGSNDYIKLIYSVQESGDLDGDDLIFQTNLKFTPEEKEMLKNSVNKLGIPYGWLVNKPLQNGMILQSPDLCKAFGQAFKTNSTNAKIEGGNRVIGIETVAGNESIILGVDETIFCSVANMGIQLKQKGWIAFDRRSGLQTGSAKLGTTTLNSDVFTIEENTVCEVTGAAAEPSTPSAEKRLKELKSLLEKNLISKEIYENKAIEILKNL
jgi:hypothetical protein